MRYADPQKPKLSMPDRLVSGLTPGCFLSSSSGFTFPIPGPATFKEVGEMVEFKTIKNPKAYRGKISKAARPRSAEGQTEPHCQNWRSLEEVQPS